MNNNNHGGKRKGAGGGKPCLPESERTRRVTVSLNNNDYNNFKKLGSGKWLRKEIKKIFLDK